MCTGLKCTNWKGIIFEVTERNWKQTSSRRKEKLIWYKNGLVTWFFHPGEVPMHGAIVFCFWVSDFTRWGFDSKTQKKISLNFPWRCYFNTLITRKRNSNFEMYSCWDSERDGFSENCVVDDRKPCKNGNTHRQQKQNLFWKKMSKSIILRF